MDIHCDLAGVCVKAIAVLHIPDIPNHLPGNSGIVHTGSRGDLAENVDPVGNGSYFAGYMGMGIVFQKGIQMASAIWSHTLSGCPAVTLSEVKKVVILPLLPFSSHSCSSTTRWRWGSSSLRKPRIYRTGDPPFPEIAGLWNERR